MDWWNKEPDTWTRNWEGEEIEEDDSEPLPPIIRWGKKLRTGSGTPHYEHMLVACDDASCVFLASQFPSRVVVGSLVLPEVSMAGNTLSLSCGNKSCDLYHDPQHPHLLLVIVQYQVSSERAFSWAKTLLDAVRADTVHIFCTLPEIKIATTLGEEEMPLPTLRYLKTGNSKLAVPSQCTLLESPMIVEAVPAALLTYCEVSQAQALCYLSVANHRLLSLETVFGYEEILQGILGSLPESKVDYKKALLEVKSGNPNKLFV